MASRPARRIRRGVLAGSDAEDHRLLKRTVARGMKGVCSRAQASSEATRNVTSRMCGGLDFLGQGPSFTAES